jgi:hypothetical protein
MTKGISEAITRPEARDALLRSGYLLESRLETLIQRDGYYVEANHSYPDPDTGKSRELDLYAMSAIKAGPEERDFIFPVLLIECVNNPQPLALITKEPQIGFLYHEDVRHSGLPVKFPIRGGGWRSLPDYLGLDKFHHYCKGRVTTQFCSFRRKKDQQRPEWMALHEDGQFDCFRKLCDATDYFLDDHFKSWRFRGPEFVNIEFFYPVLVVEGELLEVRPTRSSLRLARNPHLLFRRSQFSSGMVQDYQIDVIAESFMPMYLRLIKDEAEAIARRMRRRFKEVRHAMDIILRRARRLRSPEKIREAFEYKRGIA